ERSDFLHCLRRLPLEHILHLAQINSNASLRDNMTEEWNLVNPELALAELGIQLMLSQSLQYESQMLLMLFFYLGEDQNIINEDHHEDIQIIHEDHVHQMHEVGRGISQAEGHDRVLI